MFSGRWRRNWNAQTFVPLIAVLISIGFAVFCIRQINIRLRPILLEVATTQTANHISGAVNQVVYEQAIQYTDLVTLERSETGEIIALTSNMGQANLLRAQLLSATLSALEGLELMELEIPLGSVLDWDILSALGPKIDVRMLYTGTANAKFENSFSQAGINQTCHRIMFHIDAEIAVLLPGRQCRTNVDTEVCIAETVIVGKVPETYLQIG